MKESTERIIDLGEDEHYPYTCNRCGGTGEIVVCPDDMCHGLGYCIHGDGMLICHECNGESAF